MKSRIILGIDPGTNIMGYGIIRCDGEKIELIVMDVFNLKKYPSHTDKLKKIFEQTLAIIKKYKPEELSIEAPFYGKNVQSMLKLGRAQGAAISAALYKNIPIYEYSPRKIKQSITGNGNASKEQVAAMLKNILINPFTEEIGIPLSDVRYLDATDALAVAVCHSFQRNYAETDHGSQHYKSWREFAENLHRPTRARMKSVNPHGILPTISEPTANHATGANR